MDYKILKTELEDVAYSAMTAQEAADDLNLADITRIVSSMSGSEIYLQTAPTEYAGLTDAKKSEWLSFCGIDSHNPENNGVAHKFVDYVFGGGSTTISNLSTARSETISRATEIELPFVKEGHVTTARGTF